MSVDFDELFLEEKMVRAEAFGRNWFSDDECKVCCVVCGKEFDLDDEDELTCGVCDDCIADCDFEDCLKLNGDEKEDIAINRLVVSLLDESEINNILIQHLKEANKTAPIDCSYYKDCDKMWFAEQLKGVTG